MFTKLINKINLKICFVCYILIGFSLAACRFFGETNGAYAWLRFGNSTIQPSEFAKVFMIFYGSKLLSNTDKKNYRNLYLSFIVYSLIYTFIIFVVQSDLGSAVVLFVICYCIALIPSRKEVNDIQKILFYLLIFGILGIIVLLSPLLNDFMKAHSDNYKVARFLAAADPFLYRYDNGYHIIMSLVSFANGNVFGLGYGNSIHKYMNFPNPSNDFILAIIVEELGVIGFIGFLIFYLLLLIPLLVGSIKSNNLSSKIVLFGSFIYIATHFVLNVGGVTALIPLTGVPLLLISSGGSSLLACLVGLGLSQNEIIFNRTISRNESNSRQI